MRTLKIIGKLTERFYKNENQKDIFIDSLLPAKRPIAYMLSEIVTKHVSVSYWIGNLQEDNRIHAEFSGEVSTEVFKQENETYLLNAVYVGKVNLTEELKKHLGKFIFLQLVIH